MALGGYELQVTIHSFDNPGHRCADTDCQDCCEGECSGSTLCDYYFFMCKRPAVSYVPDQNQGNCPMPALHQAKSVMAVMFVFTHSTFGVSNPITFSGVSWVSYACLNHMIIYCTTHLLICINMLHNTLLQPNDGVQPFLEIIDYDIMMS